MKTNAFTYDVGILIDFTDDELSLLCECAVAHYDERVQHSAKQGGFLYGWRNMRTMASIGCRCSFSQLDTCAKALEQSSCAKEGQFASLLRLDLAARIAAVLKSLNEKTAQLASQFAEDTWPIE